MTTNLAALGAGGTNAAAGPTCASATWQDTQNVTLSSGNTVMTKNAGGNAFNAGGRSVEQVASGDCYIEWTALNGSTSYMFGLSADDPDHDYTGIDFAFYAAND